MHDHEHLLRHVLDLALLHPKTPHQPEHVRAVLGKNLGKRRCLTGQSAPRWLESP
jgi:hypothetical protein